MPKFNAYGSVVASTFIGTFEAPDKETAMKMAEERAHVAVCHQCSRQISDPEIEEITIEEEEEDE